MCVGEEEMAPNTFKRSGEGKEPAKEGEKARYQHSERKTGKCTESQ
jgi:hypothetical protein